MLSKKWSFPAQNAHHPWVARTAWTDTVGRGVFDEPVLQALKEEATFTVKIQLEGDNEDDGS